MGDRHRGAQPAHLTAVDAAPHRRDSGTGAGSREPRDAGGGAGRATLARRPSRLRARIDAGSQGVGHAPLAAGTGTGGATAIRLPSESLNHAIFMPGPASATPSTVLTMGVS